MKQLLLCASIFLFAVCKRCDNSSVNVGTYKDSVFTEYFRRTSGWVAGDGAYSIPLNNGNSLWLWGDSHIGFYDPVTKTVPCLFQVRNAGLLMGIRNPMNQTTLVSSTSHASLFYFGTDNTYWFWPGAGYQNGDTAYVFLGRIKATGGGGFGFTGVDTNYVAKIKVANMSVSGYTILPSKNGIVFNNAIVKEGSYNYVYGIKDNGFGNDLFVARFPSANLYAKWEYYGSAGWSTNLASIQKVHSEFTSSFNICKIKNKYVLITTEFSVGCDQGKNIFSYTSDQPYGPFVNKQSIWTVNDTLQGHYPFFYLANAHPEYDNGKNELLITYCINGYGTCLNTCTGNRMNPDYYRPKAIRVPYTLIDPSL
jgi:hypothetical protein